MSSFVPACFEASTGTTSVSANGGFGDYIYFVCSPLVQYSYFASVGFLHPFFQLGGVLQTGPQVSGLPSGSYTWTVQDSNHCNAYAAVVITELESTFSFNIYYI